MVDEPRKPQPDDDDYVGYGHPPKKNRFQKGRSGNPGGKPKRKVAAGAADIAAVLSQVLSEPQRVTVKGRQKRMSQLELNIRSLAQRAITDNRAMKLLKDMIKEFGVVDPIADEEPQLLVVGAPMTSLAAWYAEHGGRQPRVPHALLDELERSLSRKNSRGD